MTEFEQTGADAMMARWRHPETDVVINDEDMPVELLPRQLAERELGAGRSGPPTPLTVVPLRPTGDGAPPPVVIRLRTPDDAA